MSDNQQTEGTPSVQPSGNPQTAVPQQAELQIPAGKRLVDDAEFQRMSRHSEQYRGAAPLISRLVERGVKSPEDFDRVWQRNKQIEDLGIDLDQFGKAFNREEPGQEQQASPFDPEQIRSVVRDSFTEQMKIHEHEQLARSESRLMEQAAKEIAGENASAARLNAVKQLLLAEARGESAILYDDGHPLASSQFRPHDERSIAAVKQKVGAQFKELLGAQIREAAKGGTPSPGQADTGGDGPSTSGKQNGSYLDMSADEKKEWIRKNFYSEGQPVSGA